MRAGQLPGVTASRERGQRTSESEKFMTAFGKPVRSLSCECERSDDTTLNQAFQLITGALLNKMLSEPNNRLGRLLATGKPTTEILDELYLAALSRPPSAKERLMALSASNRRRIVAPRWRMCCGGWSTPRSSCCGSEDTRDRSWHVAIVGCISDSCPVHGAGELNTKADHCLDPHHRRLVRLTSQSTSMNQTLAAGCTNFRQARLSRRSLLRVGGLGFLGLNLPGLPACLGTRRQTQGARKSVIFLHQYGGPSHHDTFDMKPNAPDAIRGEFKPIVSKVPGMPVCERLPRMANVMDKVTLLHSLQHEMKNHNSGRPITVSPATRRRPTTFGCAIRTTSFPPTAPSSIVWPLPGRACRRSWPFRM